jgi:hypothetical protein
MHPVLRRCLISLLMLVDAAWWLVACLSIMAGWRYRSAGLHTLGVLALMLVAWLHFMLDLFPMRWFGRLTDAIDGCLFHHPPTSPGER